MQIIKQLPKETYILYCMHIILGIRILLVQKYFLLLLKIHKFRPHSYLINFKNHKNSVSKLTSQDEPDKESVILQRQLVGILNNLLDEQDNFRDRYNALVLDGATSEELPEWNKRYILMREAFSKVSKASS